MKKTKKRVLVCDAYGCYHQRVTKDGGVAYEEMGETFEPDGVNDFILVKSKRRSRDRRGFVVVGFLAVSAWISVVLSWVH